jgi:hypothetical protein
MLAPIWGKLISACEATQKLKLEERFGAPSHDEWEILE